MIRRLLSTALLLAFCVAPALAQEAGQTTFATPEEASKALVAASQSGDIEVLTKLVGSNAKAMITSGDAAEDAANRAAFAKKCQEGMRLVPQGDSLIMFLIGKDSFPSPLPLVKKNNAWYFDGQLGLEEVRARRIGRNELNVIRACEAYVEAQRAFAGLDPDGSGILQYAQSFQSQGNKHDGLYWKPGPGEVASPLGPFLAEAGNTAASAGKPFHGYFFRILTKQGPAAPGGAHDYILNGHMVAGFALVAYPAEYSQTGIMTFIVGPAGVVYQRDLKSKTAELGKAMDSFDPGKEWKRL